MTGRHIEVEKKVKLETHHLTEIESKGTFIQETLFEDIYYDTEECSLTVKNIWLRERENKFELKVGIKGSNGFSDRYEEIRDEKAICRELGLTISDSLGAALSKARIVPFACFVTRRKRYRLEDFTVDIDVADFGDLTYNVAEFELIVPNVNLMQDAEDKIKTILKNMQIDCSATIPAKLTYYLYHRRPHHYNKLVENQVIKPI